MSFWSATLIKMTLSKLGIWCWVLFCLIDKYFLCWLLKLLTATYAECHYMLNVQLPSVPYAECHLLCLAKLGNCDTDIFVIRHHFHIMSLKFLKFERVQKVAKKFKNCKSKSEKFQNLMKFEEINPRLLNAIILCVIGLSVVASTVDHSNKLVHYWNRTIDSSF